MAESVATPTIALEDESGAAVQNALGVPEPQGGAPTPQPAAVTTPPSTDSNGAAAVPAPVTPPVTPTVVPEPNLEPSAEDTPAMRGLKAALAREREKNRNLSPQVEAAKYLTQQLSQHPDIANQLDQRIRGIQTQPPNVTATPATATPEFSEQELRDTAQNLVLFDPQKPGELDLKAAERVLKSFKSMATTIATQAARDAVQPVASHVQQTKLQTNSQRILTQAQSMGIQPDVMQPLLGAIGASQPELLDDPGVGQLLMFIAKGMAGAAPPVAAAPPVVTPSAAPREPILTEPAGGSAVTTAKPLDDLEARVARKLGLTHDKYNDVTSKLPTQGGWRHITLE